ncbi:MAG: hypothetical protein NT007_03300 [Candidatus Kapabacteria bacterium]|nr:hypothetical protein [Candidatus Kapabacteria bacterium]
MNTYSEYVQITSDRLIINFPSDFYKGKALVEITPVLEEKPEDNEINLRRQNFRELLLQRPSSLSDDEVQNFKQISQWMNQLEQEEF